VYAGKPHEGSNVFSAIALFGLPITNPTLQDGRIGQQAPRCQPHCHPLAQFRSKLHQYTGQTLCICTCRTCWRSKSQTCTQSGAQALLEPPAQILVFPLCNCFDRKCNLAITTHLSLSRHAAPDERPRSHHHIIVHVLEVCHHKLKHLVGHEQISFYPDIFEQDQEDQQ
jgi:hypothetical protein